MDVLCFVGVRGSYIIVGGNIHGVPLVHSSYIMVTVVVERHESIKQHK